MDIKSFEAKLQSVTEHAKRELGGLRANRPTPLLIEEIRVEYADTTMPVKQLGTINIAPPRDLTVTAWDGAALAPIAKAIENAKLGVTVAVQGNIVRVTLPSLSDERRKEIVKVAKALVEASRIKVRVVRDEAMKSIEVDGRAKIISENEKFNQKKKTQDAVDKINKELDAELAAKTKEISE